MLIYYVDRTKIQSGCQLNQKITTTLICESLAHTKMNEMRIYHSFNENIYSFFCVCLFVVCYYCIQYIYLLRGLHRCRQNIVECHHMHYKWQYIHPNGTEIENGYIAWNLCHYHFAHQHCRQLQR